MRPETNEIEVEVLEIDGVAPLVPQPHGQDHGVPPEETRDWRHWQGRVARLDSRWWPLWVLLGAIAMVVVLTLGLVLGVLFLIFRVILGIVRAILR